MRRLITLLSLGLAMRAAAISLSLLLAAQAAATPQNAHYHYMVGARANAAMNFAKQLHYEAVQPGDFHLQLARTNAADLERLAWEIQEWAGATEKVNSPEQNTKIEAQLKRMREEAQQLEKDSAELGAWIDQAVAAGSKADEALRTKIAARARDQFQGFRRIMAAHKEAEEILGIPVPEDPPTSK